MRRRTLLAAVAIGLPALSGCFDSNTETTDESAGADAPEFDVTADAPGTVILLRQQSQAPNGIRVTDDFEIAVALGNAGGEPVGDDVSVDLLPPTDDESVQSATIVVDGDDELPSGAARFFTVGPFEATVAGDWELTGGPEIERVHPEYDGTVTVDEQPSD